jgi:hypothetical protein
MVVEVACGILTDVSITGLRVLSTYLVHVLTVAALATAIVVIPILPKYGKATEVEAVI